MGGTISVHDKDRGTFRSRLFLSTGIFLLTLATAMALMVIAGQRPLYIRDAQYLWPFIVFDAGMAGFGAALLAFRRRSLRRPMVWVTGTLSIAAWWGTLEYLCSSPYELWGPGPQFSLQDVEGDIGWMSRANDRWECDVPGYGFVRHSTGPHGFRVWGDPASHRRKIWTIGDSFTAGTQVSDGETYPDILKSLTPEIELFSYGCGGYGTLQEYLIFDRHLDVVRPDLVVLQLHANNFYDDVFDLAGRVHGRLLRARPYWEDGRVVFRDPTPLPFLGNFSSVILHGRKMLGRYLCNLLGEPALVMNSAEPDDPRLSRSYEVTSEMLQRIRTRAGATPIVAFCAYGTGWVEERFDQLCRRNGIPFLKGCPDALEKAKAGGIRIDSTPQDRHWTREGHRIAGEWLHQELTRAGLLSGEPRTP